MQESLQQVQPAMNKGTMYVKIHGTTDYAPNTGSCVDLVCYLEKENTGDFSEDRHFFSHSKDIVRSDQVMVAIDNNIHKLKSKEAKFFMLTINPSKDELEHIGNNPEKLKAYTRKVMDVYAENFGRKIEGRPLQGEDLLYFAKIEHKRIYKPEEKQHWETYSHNYAIRKERTSLKAVLSNIEDKKERRLLEGQIVLEERKFIKDEYGTVILPGNKKKGLNTHIHVIVSRKDKSGKMSLSPFAKPRQGEVQLNGKAYKIGFDRHGFAGKCEALFDRQFGYIRGMKNSYSYRYSKIHDIPGYLQYLYKMPKDAGQLAYYLLQKAIRQNREVRALVHAIPRSATGTLDKVVEGMAKLAGANPAGIGVTVIKTLLKEGIAIARGGGINLSY